ncbi:MAG: Uma2 family endonuclease [Cyanobacteriota bacterium]|nr:Uma2 family endonuclease [Cyanobacteriota bacterium]
MTKISPIVKPVSQLELAPGSSVKINNVNWQEFELILRELGNKRSSRVAYSNQSLEIVVPLPEHEIPQDLISDIVKTLLRARGRRYQPFCSTTLKKEGSAGVEPDACFYIQNYRSVLGRRPLQPDDPPPDLAIETDVTSKTTLEAYEAIAVPELWIYARDCLTIYNLREGHYVKCDRSSIFGEIAIAQIVPTAVQRAWQVGSLQALEELEETLIS